MWFCIVIGIGFTAATAVTAAEMGVKVENSNQINPPIVYRFWGLFMASVLSFAIATLVH